MKDSRLEQKCVGMTVNWSRWSNPFR